MLMKNNFIIISLSYIISYNLNNNNNKKKKIKKKRVMFMNNIKK